YHKHNKGDGLPPIVQIDHILVGQRDAARSNPMTDPLWLVGAMDAIQRILAAGVKVHRARTHRIVRTAFDIIGKRAEPPLLPLGGRPSRPLFLATARGYARARLTILAYDCAIADRQARSFSEKCPTSSIVMVVT